MRVAIGAAQWVVVASVAPGAGSVPTGPPGAPRDQQQESGTSQQKRKIPYFILTMTSQTLYMVANN